MYYSDVFQSFPSQRQPARSHQAPQVPDSDANVGQSAHVSRTDIRLNVSAQQSTPAVVPIRSENRSNVAVQQVAPAVDRIRTETRLNVTVQQSIPAVGPTVQNLEVKRKQTTIPWVQTSANGTGLQGNSPRRPTNTLGSFGTPQRVVDQTTTRDSFAQPSAAGISSFLSLKCEGA